MFLFADIPWPQEYKQPKSSVQLYGTGTDDWITENHCSVAQYSQDRYPQYSMEIYFYKIRPICIDKKGQESHFHSRTVMREESQKDSCNYNPCTIL